MKRDKAISALPARKHLAIHMATKQAMCGWRGILAVSKHVFAVVGTCHEGGGGASGGIGRGAYSGVAIGQAVAGGAVDDEVEIVLCVHIIRTIAQMQCVGGDKQAFVKFGADTAK
jgi:hypothetical protein